MKKLPPLLLALSIILFIGCQCKKSIVADNPYGLPNATQNGSNIFACLVNGQKFIAYNDPLYIGASIHNDTLFFGGKPKLKNYSMSVLIQIYSNPLVPSSYTINNRNITSFTETDSTCKGIGFNLLRFYALSGSIQIKKLDTSKKILAGIFNCSIPVQNCDTIKITEGRFDIIYQ